MGARRASHSTCARRDRGRYARGCGARRRRRRARSSRRSTALGARQRRRRGMRRTSRDADRIAETQSDRSRRHDPRAFSASARRVALTDSSATRAAARSGPQPGSLDPSTVLVGILFAGLIVRLLVHRRGRLPRRRQLVHVVGADGRRAIRSRDFYGKAGFADYPPGYLFVLWIVGKSTGSMRRCTTARTITGCSSSS